MYKKKTYYITGILVLMMIVMAAVYYKPIPIVDKESEFDNVIITYNWSESGEAANENLELTGDDAKQLQDILEMYTCRRTLTSFLKVDNVQSNEVFISIIYNGHIIHIIRNIASTTEVYVDWHKYKLGYFDDENGRQLTEEVNAFCEEKLRMGIPERKK